jgi:gentisate 1,2-dioxygenase
MTAPDAEQLRDAGSLEQLYPLLEGMGVSAGWAKRTPQMWPLPRKNFLPAHWSYDHAKAALSAAGRLINTELAERRNLILYNPLPGNEYATVRTIIAAYQMIMPGEWAKSHRHTPSALRLILDCEPGVYTIVDGQRIAMTPGDVLLTPNWLSHGHGNEGAFPGLWLDFLDVPLVQLMEAMFFEPEARDDATHVADPSTPRRAGPMAFPFAETLRRLAERRGDFDAVHGNEIELGDPALATLGLHMMELRGGVPTRPWRSTSNNVYAVVRGTGTSVIDDQRFAWRRGDVLAAPSWRAHHHEPADDAILFRVSDEPVLRSLGLLRLAAQPA